MSFRYLKRQCPVCGGIRKDCRQNTISEVIHCRHTEANPPNFTFIGIDKLGFGMWLDAAIADQQDEERRREWQQQQQAERKRRAARERKRQASALTDFERDRAYRQLLGQLPLTLRHQKDLQRRGLTDAEIRAGRFASIRPWQRLQEPVSHLLPGVNLDGRSLNIGASGYLIPIWKQGLIVGCQVRLDDAENGKYRWLTSIRKDRPHGQTSHLKASRELPLTECIVAGDPDLRLAEGVLKPNVASKRLSKSFLGAAGGLFASSPTELVEATIRLNPRYIILCPDAGAIHNRNVLHAYRRTQAIVKRLGYELLVEWWGQTDKTHPDIDEIEPGTPTQLLPYSQWDIGAASSSSKHKGKLISAKAWQEQFGIPYQIENLANIIQKKFDWAAYNTAKHIAKLTQPIPTHPKSNNPIKPETKTTAIVKWQPPLQLMRPVMAYVPGQLPTPEAWLAMGRPKVVFKAGDRLKAYQEAYRQGFSKIKDSSGTGLGKSHDSGEIDLTLFDLDMDAFDIDREAESISHLFRVDPNHRNPSTATVEQRFTPLISRHEGLDYDYSRTTPMGFPYLIKHNPSQENPAPDIAPPCELWDSFRAMGEKDRVVFGGKQSAICQNCSKFSHCSFLQTRAQTLAEHPYISADINAMGTPSHIDIGILEEAGITLKNTKSVQVSLADIERTIGQLAMKSKDGVFYAALIPILDAVHTAVSQFQPENKRYGASHGEVRQQLPTKAEMEAVIWNLYADDFINPANNVWGNPVWGYRFKNGIEQAELLGTTFVTPSLSDLRQQCDRLLYDNLHNLVSQEMSPKEKAQTLRENVMLNWLSPLLHILEGSRKYSLQIQQIKKETVLCITRPYRRHQSVVKGFGFAVLLDATASVDDLEQQLNLKGEHILELEQEQADFSNLTITIVNNIGACGKQRDNFKYKNGKRIKVESDFALSHRILKMIEALAKQHANQKMAVIDHKCFAEAYQDLLTQQTIHKFGYWFGDTRGSNQFLETEVMVNVGKPIKNLGDAAAQWQTMTGESHHPNDLSGPFGAWVQRQTISEVVQCIGRLRAHLRPHQQLASYHLGEFSEAEIHAIAQRFPGATLKRVDVYNLCPEAAPKGVQRDRGIIKAIWESVVAGVDRTTTEIGDMVGVDRTRVSHVVNQVMSIGYKEFWRVCKILYEALNSKTHSLEQLDLTDEEQWVAREFLTAVVADLEAGAICASEALTEVTTVACNYGEAVFKRMVAIMPLQTLLRLCAAVIDCLPREVCSRLAIVLEDRLQILI